MAGGERGAAAPRIREGLLDAPVRRIEHRAAGGRGAAGGDCVLDLLPQAGEHPIGRASGSRVVRRSTRIIAISTAACAPWPDASPSRNPMRPSGSGKRHWTEPVPRRVPCSEAVQSAPVSLGPALPARLDAAKAEVEGFGRVKPPRADRAPRRRARGGANARRRHDGEAHRAGEGRAAGRTRPRAGERRGAASRSGLRRATEGWRLASQRAYAWTRVYESSYPWVTAQIYGHCAEQFGRAWGLRAGRRDHRFLVRGQRRCIDLGFVCTP